ncbi:MAG: phosphate-binding protein [bacterium]|nr:MAG: phosphate-binding protein [bacterium]
MRTRVIIAIFAVLIFLPAPTAVTAKESKLPDEIPLHGAGAHFAWIMFNELQGDLEKSIGRPVKLYGKDSMYGVGCKAGIKMAKRNSADMETFGFTCCPLSPDELKKNGLTMYPLVWEPIMIVTHKSNPINSLTLKQVRGIFSGKIMNWKEVGGSDKNIVLVTRLHCGKRPGHWKTIFPGKSDFREDRINVKGAEPMINTVSDFTNSIGHVGSGWQIKSTDKIKIIKIDGYEPNPENIKAKKYPFFRMQSIITKGKASDSVKSVINFMKKSKEFKRVAKKYRMLPIE